MLDVYKNIKRIRELKGISQDELARAVGFKSRSSINKIEQGVNDITQSKLVAIANALSVSPGELLGKEAEESRDYIKRIPVLGAVRAGIPIDAIEEVEDWEEIDTRQPQFRSGTFFALRVTGDSMEPTIHDGDIVIVRQQPRVENGEIGIVTLNGETATVKEVKESSKGITLIGHNAAVYTPHFYDREEVEALPLRIIGKAVELRRKL